MQVDEKTRNTKRLIYLQGLRGSIDSLERGIEVLSEGEHEQYLSCIYNSLGQLRLELEDYEQVIIERMEGRDNHEYL